MRFCVRARWQEAAAGERAKERSRRH
jgi:hypothetical protein